jgi:GNAT superfamily N-acetyltransferase
MRIEELSKKHNRKGFDCGVEALNTYLQNTARQHNVNGGSKTFVMVSPETPSEIIGYFTLTMSQLDLQNFPAEIADNYPAATPAYAPLLARLAVSVNHQGKGYGGAILVEVMRRCMIVTDIAGGLGLFVEAKDEELSGFYQKNGFIEITTNPYTLFLPIGTIRGLLE